MSAEGVAVIGEVGPEDAWGALSDDPDAQLVDVRTRAEWAYVGQPDLSPIGKAVISVEWRRFPDMQVNDSFAEELGEHVSGADSTNIFFICRSGARSMEAARFVAARFGAAGIKCVCINVAEGFEGDRDAEGHRGGLNGWKARGLPWRQS